jgi:hypothetical protein
LQTVRPSESAQPGPAPVAVQVPSGTILIVRTADDERVVVPIRAELGSGSWQVVEVGPDDESRRMPLRELGLRYAAAAAIRVHAAQAEAELWVAEAELPSRGGVENIAVRGRSPDERELSLRVTETLRARGLTIEAPHEAEVPAGKPLAAQPERPSAPAAVSGEGQSSDPSGAQPTRGLWLELGPAATLSPGGLRPTFDGWVSVRLQAIAALSVSALLLLPLSSATVRAAEGSARISHLMLGAALDLHAIRTASLDLRFGLGCAALLSMMSGSATPPYRSATQTVAAGAPFMRSGLFLHLGGGFRLGAEALVGATLPAVSVHFGKREVAHFGGPFVVATLGLEIPILGWDPPQTKHGQR